MKERNWIIVAVILTLCLIVGIPLVAISAEKSASSKVARLATRDAQVSATKADVAEFFVEVIDGEPTIKFRYLSPKEIAQKVSAEERAQAAKDRPPEKLNWIPVEELVRTYNAVKKTEEPAKLLDIGDE